MNKRFGFLTLCLAALSFAGCGGGGGTSVNFTKDDLVGIWTQSNLSAHGQTISCPGTLNVTQTHSLECSGGQLTLNADGTYLTTVDGGETGTWFFNNGYITMSGPNSGVNTIQIKNFSSSGFNLSFITPEDGEVLVSFVSGIPNPPQQNLTFQSDRTGNDEIYIVREDGTGLVQLTSNGVYDGIPAFSPNGQKIAFDSQQSGGGIFVMNRDGSGATKISSARASYWMQWSPDGSKIAFSGFNGGHSDWEIYVMNADGTGITNITNTPSEDEESPSWSPNSQQLVFSKGGNTYKCNADGTSLALLKSNASYPAWSPTSNQIAYVLLGEIHTMNTDASGSMKITTGAFAAEKLSWSPNSQYIAFESNDFGANGYEIRKARVSDGQVSLLAGSSGYEGHSSFMRQ